MTCRAAGAFTPLLLSVSAALLPIGVFAQTGTPASSAARPRTQEGYTLAFADADVRRVVDAVLGSMLKRDYSIDPAVQGNITLRTREPVTAAALVPLLENALGSVNAVILVQGSQYKIVPRDAARTKAPFAAEEGKSDSPAQGYATEVITLKNASADSIGKLLGQFLGEEILAGTNAALNQLVITGSAEERQAAKTLVARFDVDNLADMQFELFRLENVDAETLQGELERIFQPPFEIIGTRVRLVPLPRLRSILAVAADRADITRVEPWIRRLDAGGSGKRKLYSYAVQNGRARDLAASLQLVIGMGGAGDAASEGRSLSSAAPNAGNNEPSDVIAPQTPLPGSGTQMLTGSSQGPRIVPNDVNNSLLIYASGEEYEFIREALQKLDQPVAQVLIEATLAEVTLNDDLRFGVNFQAISGNTRITNTSGTSGTPASSFPGFSVSALGSSVDAVLNSLQSRTDVRVLSAPKLMVLNNQTATLQVGDQVPIVTQQAQGVAAPGAPIVNTIELRDTGVILKVTPRVNDSGTIILDIAQEVSDVAETTTSGINSPTIQQRRITSTVATRSGQMIALGGLIRDRATRNKSGIPLLSQIPIVGGLFGRQVNAGSRTELIMLLTPTVIRTEKEAGDIVDELIRGLDKAGPIVARAREAQAGGATSK